MERLKITQESIQNELNSYKNKPESTIAEYIWNSFDAGAKTVEINYNNNELGYIESVIISDDGQGWDFGDNNTDYFMASAKKNASVKNLSLPHGKLGRGRYTFIWHADSLYAKSKGQKLTLLPDAKYKIEDCDDAPENGTTVELTGIRESLGNALKSEEVLRNFLVKEFCWFLEQNANRKIVVNGTKIDYKDFIRKEVELTGKDFSSEVQAAIGDIRAKVIIWKERPSEYAKFFAINPTSKEEVVAEHTGLNKKKDSFWHSVYLYSNKFTKELNNLIDGDESNQVELFDKDEVVSAYKLIKEEIKEKLLDLRKPILNENADNLIMNLKVENLYPSLLEFHVREEDFNDLLRQVYITAPHLFTGKGRDDQKFVVTSIAGLVSSGNSSLVMKVLSHIAELSEEESRTLEDILSRTHLSNIVKTIAEIDNRLQSLQDIHSLLFDNEKETLEVKHLQRVLDNNLWLFGENYSLFASTEGAMRNTLQRYASEILGVDPSTIETKSRKEVDLFLTRTNEVSEDRQEVLIVEIKRPSVKLGKKEFDQIHEYAMTIAKEKSLNDDKMNWEYYLVGTDYNEYIASQLENASSHGERHRGLVFYDKNLRLKIYVKKWSGIIHAENGHRLRYLKDRLKIDSKDNSRDSSDELTERLVAMNESSLANSLTTGTSNKSGDQKNGNESNND